MLQFPGHSLVPTWAVGLHLAGLVSREWHLSAAWSQPHRATYWNVGESCSQFSSCIFPAPILNLAFWKIHWHVVMHPQSTIAGKPTKIHEAHELSYIWDSLFLFLACGTVQAFSKTCATASLSCHFGQSYIDLTSWGNQACLVLHGRHSEKWRHGWHFVRHWHASCLVDPALPLKPVPWTVKTSPSDPYGSDLWAYMQMYDDVCTAFSFSVASITVLVFCFLACRQLFHHFTRRWLRDESPTGVWKKQF